MKTTRQDIIEAVDRDILDAELSSDKLARYFKELEVYIVTAHNAPNVMDEIGRIREMEFRKEGGGTGREKDIDQFDTGDIPYKQLVAWDPKEKEIVAMYRYILCGEVIDPGRGIHLATHRLFTFSERFVEEYLPYTIELGRSVVNRTAKRSLLGLFVIWSGLAALVSEYREIEYFFGKTTIYEHYPVKARDLLYTFLDLYFGDTDDLAKPREDVQYSTPNNQPELRSLFSGDRYRSDYTILRKELAQMDQVVPPILISYLRLTNTIKCYGTAWNTHFGNVLETAFLLTIRDIDQSKRKQFIETYESINPKLFTCSNSRFG